MRRVVVVSAGAGSPSSTRKLADRLRSAVESRLPGTQSSVLDLREIGQDLLTATTSGLRSEQVDEAIDLVSNADALIAVTPVFNGSFSGLFKLFFDVLDEGTLRDVPVLLGATGGTARCSATKTSHAHAHATSAGRGQGMRRASMVRFLAAKNAAQQIDGVDHVARVRAAVARRWLACRRTAHAAGVSACAARRCAGCRAHAATAPLHLFTQHGHGV